MVTRYVLQMTQMVTRYILQMQQMTQTARRIKDRRKTVVDFSDCSKLEELSSADYFLLLGDKWFMHKTACQKGIGIVKGGCDIEFDLGRHKTRHIPENSPDA